MPEGASGGRGEVVTVELTRSQQALVRRVAESKATIPELTLTATVDMERCLAWEAELSAAQTSAPSCADMVIRACALALRTHPRANGSYRDGRWELHSRVNVGVTLAGPEVLVVATIFDADIKPLSRIAGETRELGARVRAGTITPPELSGATFTLSNLGVAGVDSTGAVISPPHAAVMSVGAIEPRALVRDGAVVARQAMSVTLTCDHRILYGREAGEFLRRVCDSLEHPHTLSD